MNSRLVPIFNEAHAIEASDERAAFLAQACGADRELRDRIEQMLADAEGADDFFHDDATTVSGADGGGANSERGGMSDGGERVRDRIGAYKLLQQIGEGGFGKVWMAEQTKPVERRVALKIIKLGMDTKEVIARFEVERRALAMMEHPGIATIYDAGATDSGRPYFVMELVKGVPITKFCDSQRLGTVERLVLFGEVCSAINHAHQKGVIHRDLKPSNILVALDGEKPIPKIIDFGIAKATQGRLSEQTLFTLFEQFIGTPAYMSPEQAEVSGLDVDTRSDVYSLGVLLYELLTGKQPFDTSSLAGAGYDEMRRIIREDTPPKPSTRISTIQGEERTAISRSHDAAPDKLGKLVRGDLDWIVMKALEKDRSRRYGTADAFAKDIARFLADEPVEAAAPSAAYKLGKFVRRNRGLVAGVITVVSILVGASVFSIWQANKAREAERITAVARIKAERVIQETNEVLVSELRSIGRLSLLDGVAATAVSSFDELPPELLTPETDRLRASAIENLAALLADKNEISAANEKFEAAIAIRQALVGNPNARVGSKRELALALAEHAKILMAQGGFEAASERLQRAREVLLGGGKMVGLGTPDLEALTAVYQIQNRLSVEASEVEAELVNFARFRDAAKLLVSRSDFEPGGELLAAESILEGGDLAMQAGDGGSASRRYAEAAGLFDELLAKRPDDTRIIKSLAVAFDRQGDAHSFAGRHLEALASYRQYADAMLALTKHDPSNYDWQRELSVALNEQGDQLLKLRNPGDAREKFAEALALRRKLAAVDPDHKEAQIELASSLFRMGELAFAVKSPSEAIDHFTEAVEVAGARKGQPGKDTALVEKQLGSLKRLALAYVMRKQAGDGEKALQALQVGVSVANAWVAAATGGDLADKYSAEAFRKLAGKIRQATSPGSKRSSGSGD